MNNSNKTISVNSQGIVINYTDSNKHMFIRYPNQDKSLRKKEVQKFEDDVFNERQQKMYEEALYGLSVHPESLVNRMPKRVLLKIVTRCQLVEKAINRWKQEIVNNSVDKFLLTMFPNSPVVKDMVDIPADDTIKCKFTFKQLGVTPMDVAKKLVSLNLLPQNFFDLK